MGKHKIMAYSFLFAVFIAASSIFIEDAADRYPLWFSIFFNSLITSIFFSILTFKNIKDTYKMCLNNITIAAPLMMSSMLIYALCFFSTDLIGGSPYNIFYFATSGFLGYLSLKTAILKIHKYIATALAILIITYATYRSLYVGLLQEELLGACYAVFAGLSGFLYAVFSKKLVDKSDFTPMQILSIRFLFLLAISSFLLPENTKELISYESMLYMLVLTITGMVLPVYFLQKGIHAIGPEKNAIIVAFVPFLTLLFSTIFHQFFDTQEAIFVVILTLFLLLRPGAILCKRIRQQRET